VSNKYKYIGEYIMESKFKNLYENIIKESTGVDSPSVSKFMWKNARFLRQLKDQELSKEISIKVVDELVNELKEAIGSKITVEFPAKGDVEIEVTKLSNDEQFVFYNGKNQFTGAPEEKKYLIGMLMTDKAFEMFYNLMEPKLKENKINAEKAAEEKRIADEKAASEKKATYENEEVQKFIKSLPIGLIGDYTWNKRPLPNEWKQEFSEQPENIKIGFINYIDDMKFHDPSIEYIDYGYFDAKAKERDANDRSKQLVKELKSL
jgi:hypothetical protein